VILPVIQDETTSNGRRLDDGIVDMVDGEKDSVLEINIPISVKGID